jgi:hypothetical protein
MSGVFSAACCPIARSPAALRGAAGATGFQLWSAGRPLRLPLRGYPDKRATLHHFHRTLKTSVTFRHRHSGRFEEHETFSIRSVGRARSTVPKGIWRECPNESTIRRPPEVDHVRDAALAC